MGTLPILIRECLNALHQCHTNNSVSESGVAYQAQFSEHFEIRTADVSATDGTQIARRFATEAAKRLSQQQFRQLLQEVPKAMEMMNRVLRCMRKAVEDQLCSPQVFEIRRVLADAC
jgi:glycerol-3-phosphate O-acyltransferase